MVSWEMPGRKSFQNFVEGASGRSVRCAPTCVTRGRVGCACVVGAGEKGEKGGGEGGEGSREGKRERSGGGGGMHCAWSVALCGPHTSTEVRVETALSWMCNIITNKLIRVQAERSKCQGART